MLCCLFFAYLTIDPLRASEGYAWDSWQPPFKVWLGFNGGLAMNRGSLRSYFDDVLWFCVRCLFLAATIVGLYSPQANNQTELTYYLKAYGSFSHGFNAFIYRLHFLREMGIGAIGTLSAFRELYSLQRILVFAVFFSLGILRNQVFGIERVFKKNTVRVVLGALA